MAGSRLQASATMGASSDGALAPGNLPMVAVDLGEAPPVIVLAWQALGGLGNGGSKARAAAWFFVWTKRPSGKVFI
jgi:hypothetical protein